jgi:predicted CoA-binding protein
MSNTGINEAIPQILSEYKNIAVVGVSTKPDRDSHSVARFMLMKDYNMVPVNPVYPEVLGKTCYPSLLDIPEKIELVDIFRKPDQVLPIVEQAIQIGAKAVWMQLGVINEEAAELALDSGLEVVMNRCWKIEYQNYLNNF